jgi:cytochrome P450
MASADFAEQLRADTARASRDAIEALLRLEGPVTATRRYTARPVEIGGVVIPAGEIVLISLASANRDEGRFARPAELDLGRFGAGHLGFGHGPHQCIGAPLARMESCVALRALVRRFPRARPALDPRDLVRRRDPTANGLVALPTRLVPERGAAR